MVINYMFIFVASCVYERKIVEEVKKESHCGSVHTPCSIYLFIYFLSEKNIYQFLIANLCRMWYIIITIIIVIILELDDIISLNYDKNK